MIHHSSMLIIIVHNNFMIVKSNLYVLYPVLCVAISVASFCASKAKTRHGNSIAKWNEHKHRKRKHQRLKYYDRKLGLFSLFRCLRYRIFWRTLGNKSVRSDAKSRIYNGCLMHGLNLTEFRWRVALACRIKHFQTILPFTWANNIILAFNDSASEEYDFVLPSPFDGI